MKIMIGKILSLVLLSTFCLACKKEYACRCTTTISYNNRNDIYSSKTKNFSEKMTKKQAESVCTHEAESINSTHYNFITNSGNWPTTTKVNTDCLLQ